MKRAFFAGLALALAAGALAISGGGFPSRPIFQFLTVNSGAAQNSANFNSTNANGAYIAFQKSGANVGYIGTAASLNGGLVTDSAVRSDGGLCLDTGGGNCRLTIDSSGNTTFQAGQIVATALSAAHFPANTDLAGQPICLSNGTNCSATPTIVASLSSTTARTTTTQTDEAQLHIALATGHRYAIHGVINWLCSIAGSGLKWNLTFSGTNSVFIETDTFQSGTGGTGSALVQNSNNASAGGSSVSNCSVTGGTFNSVVLDGTIVTTSAGTFSLQDAQNIATGTTTVQIGSYLIATQIG